MANWTKFNILFENKDSREEVQKFLYKNFVNFMRVGNKQYYFTTKNNTPEQVIKMLRKFPKKKYKMSCCYEGDWSYNDTEIWKTIK